MNIVAIADMLYFFRVNVILQNFHIFVIFSFWLYQTGIVDIIQVLSSSLLGALIIWVTKFLCFIRLQ